MSALIIAELLAWGIFQFWPVVETESEWRVEETREKVEFQDIEITRQENIPASPPKPAIPLVPPEEKIIEEDILIEEVGSEAEFNERIGIGMNPESGLSGSLDNPVKNPDRPPSLFKIVEPVVPKEAKQAGIKAIIEVRFLINPQGNVEEASIARIKLYDEDGENFKVVDHIGYGLPEATLNAALQWKFTPAVKDGEKVLTSSIHTFSYGF